MPSFPRVSLHVQSPWETPIDNLVPRGFSPALAGRGFSQETYAEHSCPFCMEIPPILETTIGLVYKTASLSLRTSVWEATNRQTIGKVSISISRASTRLNRIGLHTYWPINDWHAIDIQCDTGPGPTNTRSICRPSARFDRYSADISTDGVD